MNQVPSFELGESGYRVQLRPLPTAKDDREAGRQNYALCLWLTRSTGSVAEICALSGFIIDKTDGQEGGTSEMLSTARRWLLMEQQDWSALNKDEQRTLMPGHVRWRSDEEAVEVLTKALDAAISARA
jgi:hypothetical protein